MTQPKIEGVGHGVPRMLYASDGSNWYAILVDSDGHVKIDVVSAALPTDAATETTLALIKGYVDNLEILLAGGLPAALDSLALKVKEQSPLTGFATSANQTTMITALQLIDDLRAALGSVNTDDLQVDLKTYPGSNALGNFPFGYYDRYWEREETLTAAAGTNYLTGSTVPADEMWVITNLRAVNVDTNPSSITFAAIDASVTIAVVRKLSPGANVDLIWTGHVYLRAGDYIRCRIDGCTLNDDLLFDILGYKMKVA